MMRHKLILRIIRFSRPYIFIEMIVDTFTPRVLHILNGSNRIVVFLTTEVSLVYDDCFEEEMIPLLYEELEYAKYLDSLMLSQHNRINDIY